MPLYRLKREMTYVIMALYSTIFAYAFEEVDFVTLLRYHESKQRGSLDFPLDYHYLDESHPRYQMPYHWHEEYEILHVRSGEFVLTLDGETISLHSGDVAFISAEQLHGGRPHDCIYECIVFDMRLLLKCNDHCKNQISDIRHHRISLQAYYPANDRIIRHTIPPMFNALHDQCPGYELITLGCLFQFLGEVYKHGAFEASPCEQNEGQRILQLKQVFELIETSYASSLTLGDMAGSVHMTPKYFCRFFKATTHRTPVDYLNYFRIEEACNEIAATDRNLTEIALNVGFSNLNYFIRQFKKYKGITPGQYLSRIRSAK